MPAVRPDARRVTGSYLRPLLETAQARGVGARELANAPHCGLHVGERVKLGTYSVYGLILLSCRDFGLELDGDNAQYHWLSIYPDANGYQEQSAFTHAFKEWAGANPGAWREGAQCRL